MDKIKSFSYGISKIVAPGPTGHLGEQLFYWLPWIDYLLITLFQVLKLDRNFKSESKSVLDKIKGFSYGISKIVAPGLTENVLAIQVFFVVSQCDFQKRETYLRNSGSTMELLSVLRFVLSFSSE